MRRRQFRFFHGRCGRRWSGSKRRRRYRPPHREHHAGDGATGPRAGDSLRVRGVRRVLEQLFDQLLRRTQLPGRRALHGAASRDASRPRQRLPVLRPHEDVPRRRWHADDRGYERPRRAHGGERSRLERAVDPGLPAGLRRLRRNDRRRRYPGAGPDLPVAHGPDLLPLGESGQPGRDLRPELREPELRRDRPDQDGRRRRASRYLRGDQPVRRLHGHAGRRVLLDAGRRHDARLRPHVADLSQRHDAPPAPEPDHRAERRARSHRGEHVRGQRLLDHASGRLRALRRPRGAGHARALRRDRPAAAIEVRRRLGTERLRRRRRDGGRDVPLHARELRHRRIRLPRDAERGRHRRGACEARNGRTTHVHQVVRELCGLWRVVIGELRADHGDRHGYGLRPRQHVDHDLPHQQRGARERRRRPREPDLPAGSVERRGQPRDVPGRHAGPARRFDQLRRRDARVPADVHLRGPRRSGRPERGAAEWKHARRSVVLLDPRRDPVRPLAPGPVERAAGDCRLVGLVDVEPGPFGLPSQGLLGLRLRRWYATFMSLGAKLGHLSTSGFAFSMRGCQDTGAGGPREYESRTFTLQLGP